jgi:aspartyl protease family protein
MAFIGVAIIIAGLLALLIASDAGSLVGLDQTQFGQLVFLLMVLVVVAGGVFGRRIPFSQMLAGIAMWVAVFGVAILAYSYRFEFQQIGARMLGELTPGMELSDGGTTVGVRRSRDGSFHLAGEINGAEVRFIFDTGASAVVLTAEDAAHAGIDVKSLRFTVPVQTANGISSAALVVLDEIAVGGIVKRRIQAFVAEPGSLDESLLGMTFLETLQSYAVARDRLELKG